MCLCIVFVVLIYEGEDEVVLDVFVKVCVVVLGLCLIFVLCYFECGDVVVVLLMVCGLDFVCCSQGGGLEVLIFLVDMLGEMGDWYQVVGICIICGFYVDYGGYILWEFVVWCCVILYGFNVLNYVVDYVDLDVVDVVEVVLDLVVVLSVLVQDVLCQCWMGKVVWDMLLICVGDFVLLIVRIFDFVCGGFV